MRFKIFLSLLLLSFTSQAEILEGIAKNQKGEIIYFERHNIQMDNSGLNKYIRVEYTQPDGSLFATMTSDFSLNKTIPETTFEDTRFKTKAFLRLNGKNVEFEEFKNDKSVSKKIIPMTDVMVASQGFDNFIKINFSKLEKDSVKFRFGVLENKDFYSLTAYKIAQKGAEVEFGIKATAVFLRLFANELKVTYDTNSKQLKSFSGRSNILDNSGKPQDVSITYKWKNINEK